MNISTRFPIFCTLVLILLPACGGSSSSDSDDTSHTLSSGEFVDSAVQGLNYRTDTNSGTTDTEGSFSYLAGEEVIFSIGDIDFASVTGSDYITPLDIFAVIDINNPSVVNMARLLQTLDLDGDANNGITIPPAAHTLATGLIVDFSAVDFDLTVSNLVANAGGVNLTLIDGVDAVNHLQQTLDNLPCGNDHNKVGYSGSFSTVAHDVSGTVVVVDNCTIEVTMFVYDGGGPEVYFYGGIDHNYTAPGAFSIGPTINGTNYVQETIILTLPNGKTLDDFNTLSVWCAVFEFSFGDLTLAAP